MSWGRTNPGLSSPAGTLGIHPSSSQLRASKEGSHVVEGIEEVVERVGGEVKPSRVRCRECLGTGNRAAWPTIGPCLECNGQGTLSAST